MATFQSDHGKGVAQTPLPYKAGDVHTARFEYTFAGAVATTDVVEMGVLPAGSRVTDLIMICANMGAINGTVGIMSGTPGDKASVRTVGAEFFSAASLADGVTRMSLATGFNLAATDADRSIGMTVGTNVAAGATKKVTLLVSYVQ